MKRSFEDNCVTKYNLVTRGNAMGELHIYDKAKYHMTGDSGAAPSWEHASATPLFMIRWCLDRGFIDADFEEEHTNSLLEIKNGSVTLFQFYENECDLVFASDMLSEEGNAFVGDYFEYDTGPFLKDLFTIPGLTKSGDYPLYTDADYLRVKPLIDSRYAEWKKGKPAWVTPGRSQPSLTRRSLYIAAFVGMIVLGCLLIWGLIKLLALF